MGPLFFMAASSSTFPAGPWGAFGNLLFFSLFTYMYSSLLFTVDQVVSGQVLFVLVSNMGSC